MKRLRLVPFLFLLLAPFAPGCDKRIGPQFATATGSPTATATPEPAGFFRMRIDVTLPQTLERYPLAVWIENADSPQTFLRTVAVYRGDIYQYSDVLYQWWRKAGDASAPSKIPPLPPGTYTFLWSGLDGAGLPAPTYSAYRILVETSNWGLPETDDYVALDMAAYPASQPSPTPVVGTGILLQSVRVELLQ